MHIFSCVFINTTFITHKIEKCCTELYVLPLSSMMQLWPHLSKGGFFCETALIEVILKYSAFWQCSISVLMTQSSLDC